MTFNSKPPTILIVDDMPINIQILARALKATYGIKIATRGEKALEIAAGENPPDLILLDIMMPEMDGYEVIRRLKGDEATRNIPVIFITVRDKVTDESKGFDLGAVDYITKPFQLPVVQARIRTHIELKRKTDMLEQLVSLDGLTAIPNRRRFDEGIKKEWKRAVRSGSPLSVAMIDIDHFKKYNDHYGHTRGDDCLKAVAHCLQSSLERPADMVARYGGEEFVAILPETDHKGAKLLSDKMRRDIEDLGIPHLMSETVGQVTVSIGAASEIPIKGQSYLQLLETADQQLYQAKTAGRNRVACAED